MYKLNVNAFRGTLWMIPIAWNMLSIYYSSISFLVTGLIGNVLVKRIVHKTGEMHTPTNYLLVSITTSDNFTILLWFLDLSGELEEIVCKLI